MPSLPQRCVAFLLTVCRDLVVDHIVNLKIRTETRVFRRIRAIVYFL